MREFVLLDSGPLGHASRRRGTLLGDQCRRWLDDLLARGVDIIVPEIADYEVRRELTRIGASGSLHRLDSLVATGQMTYAPITTAEWRTPPFFGPTPASTAYRPPRRTPSMPT